MDYQEYRVRGKQMIDYIAKYLETIRSRRVLPDVKPGYMVSMLPDSAPYDGESFTSIMMDVERIIMPGVTHWQSPHMHAYFPALNSPASLLGDMLSDGIGCIGFTWASSPACTELEIIVMDWLGKMIGLPKEFFHLTPEHQGGGCIQTSASVATFVCLLAARTKAIGSAKVIFENLEDAEINSRLVAYTSDQAHSSVEKAGLIGLVKMRYIETDDILSLRGDKLKEAIKQDKEKGLIPFFLCATLGTTGACAFDNLEEIGPICESENIWIHVDAAYAGTAFICPEYRKWMKGIEFAHSFAFNPSKWMMVHFDCTAMWVKNSGSLHRTFNVEPLYLKHENSGLAVDFMHWQIPLSKRFHALKLWFVIRNYGIRGLQDHVRRGIRLAQEFECLVQADERFEIAAPRHLGLVVFRIRGENELTEALLKKINTSGQLHSVPASLKGKYVIRFTVTSTHTESADIHRDWTIIKDTASAVLKPYGFSSPSSSKPLLLSEIKKRNPDFGTSLLLSNSPMTPKIMNGSFVAIFEATDAVQEFMRRYGKALRMVAKDSPVLQRRLRGMLASDRQFSLDSQMDVISTLVASTVPVEEKSEENGHMKKITKAPRNLEAVRFAYNAKEDQTETPILEEKGEISSDSDSSISEKICKTCGQLMRNK